MEPALQEQIDYYRARAGEYDDFWLRRGPYALEPAALTRWQADAAETEAFVTAAVRPGASVLELAAGTGLFTRLLAVHAAEVHCVDASPETLALNRERMAAGSTPISYEVADLFNWQPAAQYDVVAFTFWLSHVPDDRLAAFWAMVSRALAPGGTVVVVDSQPDLARSAPRPGGAAANGSTASLERRQLRDGRKFQVVKRYWSPAELTADLASRGWHANFGAATNGLVLYGTATRP